MSRAFRVAASLALLALSAIAVRSLLRPQVPAQADEPAAKTKDESTAHPREAEPDDGPAPPDIARSDRPDYVQERLRGRVVWFSDALKRNFDIQVDADVAESQVVLETPEGALHPIVKDSRGRAFHIDEQWRNIDVELLVRRHKGSPYLQVIQVYAIEPSGKFVLDYWCDICAIAMYELKACECCQQPNRLRKRPVADEEAP